MSTEDRQLDRHTEEEDVIYGRALSNVLENFSSGRHFSGSLLC